MLRARARRKLLEREGEHDLRSFIEYALPDHEDPEHLAELCDVLDRSMTEPVFVLLEAPPRHWKTETVLAALARRLRYRPKDLCAYASYSAPMALRKSRRCREIAARAGVWVGEETRKGQRFDPSQAVSYWQTHDGGGLIAGGRGGGFVGEGFDLLVIDDPYKGRAEAESPTVQAAVWDDLWLGTLSTRIEPGGSVIVTHQPWNHDDLLFRLVKWAREEGFGDRVTHIRLPAVIDAEYDGDRLIGGKPLAPTRYTLEDLAFIAAKVKSYNWHSQYQCERVRSGRKIFGELGRYDRAGYVMTGKILLISCDPGIESNERAEARKSEPDPAGIVVAAAWTEPGWALDEDGRRVEAPALHVDVLWAEQRWLDGPDLLDHLESLQNDEYGGAQCILEEVSAFRLLGQMGERLNPGLSIVEWLPRGSKALRAWPTADAARDGRVRVPTEGEWLGGDDGFLAEIRSFDGRPGGRDNRVDALVQLYDYAEQLLCGGAAAAVGAGAPSGLASTQSAWGSTVDESSSRAHPLIDLARR